MKMNKPAKQRTVASFGRMSVCQRSQKKLNINSDPFPTQSSDVRINILGGGGEGVESQTKGML